jgi:hypothetical protein
MSVTLTVRDETAAGRVYNELPLEFPSERITVRELIRERVYQEVQDFNRNHEQNVFRGLVQPSDTKRVLNGSAAEFRLPKHRSIDWKEQFEKATEAFVQNGFLVLIDNQQVGSLDEEFVIRHGTKVSFIKLTLLIGG